MRSPGQLQFRRTRQIVSDDYGSDNCWDMNNWTRVFREISILDEGIGAAEIDDLVHDVLDAA